MSRQRPTEERDLEAIARRLGYRSLRRYQSRAKFLFQDLPLQDATVLDVGCGPGAFTIWPALQGAKHVLGIEPEVEGATTGTLGLLRQTVTDHDLVDQIDTRGIRLDEVSKVDGPFDVVVTYNVINHLNENAVQLLPGDADAQGRYRDIFSDIATLMTPGGILIVADCARSNGWDKLGLRAPLATNIEWQKHLDPNDWLNLLRASGFELLDLRWSYHYPLRRLTSNRLVQYWTSSHFVLRVRRADDA